ncbi:hypothetical protein [Actinoplanes solisilvae]|uniref:hypothetical protein n=1 Tax=Actinoplanes solisilvae TaxID=2486853 RepID=UPI000FDCD96C|nr:hypothetical protein [Actinoplanes solisilvae]
MVKNNAKAKKRPVSKNRKRRDNKKQRLDRNGFSRNAENRTGNDRNPLRKRLVRMLAVATGAVLTAALGAAVTAFTTPLGSTPRVAPLLDRMFGDEKPLDIVTSFGATWPAAFSTKSQAENFVNAYNDGRADLGQPRLWGGVPATTSTSINLRIVGNLYQPVRLTSFAIKFVSKRAPITTAFVEPPGGRGGVGDFEVLTFNLDEDVPVGLFTSTDGRVTDIPYVERRTATLVRDETLNFLLNMKSQKHSVGFEVHVGYEFGESDDLQSGTEVLTDNGKPFAFTALAPFAQHSISGPTRGGIPPRHAGYKYAWLSNPDGSKIVPSGRHSEPGK